jgi:hypothetical protein
MMAADSVKRVVGGKVAETEELEEIIWECVDGDGWVRWTWGLGWRLDEGSDLKVIGRRHQARAVHH